MATDTFIDTLVTFERIEQFKGSIVAIEASWYLQKFLDTKPAKEPLVSALGGLPFSLKKSFEADLDNWEKTDIHPLFIFEGLSVSGQDEIVMRNAKEASTSIQDGWQLYSDGNPNDAVAAFGRSGAIQAKYFYRAFQKLLFERDIHYEIAAYSAAAHIAQLEKSTRPDGTSACSLSMGSLELLLYPLTSAVLTKIDFEAGFVHGFNRADVMQTLGVNSEDPFIDVLLMTGNSFLPAFPALKDTAVITNQPYTIKDAYNMYRASGRTMAKVCQLSDDQGWLDRYRRAKLAVMHNIRVVMEPDSEKSEVIVSNIDSLTGDHHEYLGLSLPQELYHYMIHGAIGPRILNWLVYLKMLVPPPLDGGDSEEYRQLITEQLVPIRAQTIALYTSRLHRLFQHKNFSMVFWFDPKATVEVNHQTIEPTPRELTGSWHVKEKDYEKAEQIRSEPGSITFALAMLENAQFAASTISKGSLTSSLKTQNEIMVNTMWRFLQLRGYINEKHGLSTWGTALLTTLKNLNPIYKQEEAAFLAFELLRFDQLNIRHPHNEQIGAPQRGSEDDRGHCLLISRCASLLKIRHEAVGYTGPLSKNLLAYHSIVSTVREADRDLIEAILASMFLWADADRRFIVDSASTKERKRNGSDWRKSGFNLPFGTDIDVALGIAVKTWLDDHVKPGLSDEEKTQMKTAYTAFLPHGENFAGDLDLAFNFFESLFSGVQEVKTELTESDFAVWMGASEYLSLRR